MFYLTRNVAMKYRNQAGEGGDAGGGAGGTAADEAAKAAAEADAAKAAEKKTGPSDEEARLLKEVMDKKTKLTAASSRIAELEAAVKQFEGIDVDGVRKMLQDKQDDETRKLEEKGQWDSLKKQMVEGFGKERDELATKAAEAASEAAKLKAQIGDLTVGNAFQSSEFIKEDMTMPVGKARVLYGAHFEFSDGSVKAFDKPAGSAERNVLVDAKGDPLGFEDAIKKIVESDPDRDQLLKSKIKQGAGSKTIQKSGAPAQVADQPSGKDRIAAALLKGGLQKK